MEIERISQGCQPYELKILNLYLLMYANDTVLFSENIEDLQKMINCLNDYSNKYNLFINCLKTKIVVFRNRGQVKANERWYLNGNSIDMCDEFVYLGILFRYNGNFTYTQKSLANQGRKALFSLYSKLQDDCFNFETMLSLFDTYVASILNYSCEVWGNHKCDDIEQVQMKFLKRILKVNASTVNYMVYCELGRYPMFIERYCRMLKYWFKLICTDNCILKCCFEEMLERCIKKPNDKYNWACRIRDILYMYGFQDVWLHQGVKNVDLFSIEFKDRVKGSFHSEINSFFEDSPKCMLYRYVFDPNMLQFYLDHAIIIFINHLFVNTAYLLIV